MTVPLHPSASDDTVRRLSTALAGRYRIERELGAGGMATVYLAEDLRHKRLVALKVLHAELSAVLGPERFLKEIELTANLQHPHILPLFDSGEADGRLYYVMPLVDGETLRARLEREQQLPIADALRIATEVADALNYAHGRGVIHRDVKPENVLLQGGHALVADFGIALAVQQAGGQRMTQTGLSLGTPQYMSPEQAMGERTIDARSDVYAVGAMTYEMLVGEPPYTGPTTQAIVARLLSEPPRGIVAQRRSVPLHVEAAVLRALEKLPADRFASAADFAAALAAPVAVTGATHPAVAGGRWSRRAPLVALGTIAVVATALAAWAWRRPVPTPDVVRYRLTIDSVPAVKFWGGELAIAPDGATIVRTGGPNGLLLVRHRDELGFSPLAGTEGATAPFFSPDGTRVGYYVNGAVVAVPLGGGPPQTLLDSLGGADVVVWGPDGMLYRTMLSGATNVIVRCAPQASTRCEPVTAVDSTAGELTHLLPEPLGDGSNVLFQVTFRDGRRSIAMGDTKTKRHTVLLDGVRARYTPDGHLVYTTIDGKLWAVRFDAGRRAIVGAPTQVGDHVPTSIVGPVDFAVSRSGTLAYSVEDAGALRELTWVTRTGAHVPIDATWKGEFASPALSPDGTRLAVAIRDKGHSDVWVRNVAGGAPVKLTGGERRNNVEPAWSADGQWISYLVSGGVTGTGDVWRTRADGSGREERVLQSRRPLSEQIWMPNDNVLLVRTTTPTTGAGDVLRFRPGTDAEPTPLIATPRAEYSPIASPDGRWLAYTSDVSGRFEIYVTPLSAPGSARWAVSTSGGSTPRWSHRGDELFYLDPSSNLVAARVASTPTFAVQGTRVLFNAADYISTSLSRRNYDVSPDDQRFLFVQRADGAKGGQVIVVEHWSEEMRRKEAARSATP